MTAPLHAPRNPPARLSSAAVMPPPRATTPAKTPLAEAPMAMETDEEDKGGPVHEPPVQKLVGVNPLPPDLSLRALLMLLIASAAAGWLAWVPLHVYSAATRGGAHAGELASAEAAARTPLADCDVCGGPYLIS